MTPAARARADIRPGYERATIRDPDDNNPNRREARTVEVIRLTDPIETLAKRHPALYRREHMAAARRYRQDHDNGLALRTAAPGPRGGSLSPDPDGRMVARLGAASAYAQATEAMPERVREMVQLVLVTGLTVTLASQHIGVNRDRGAEWVREGVDALVDWYELGGV